MRPKYLLGSIEAFLSFSLYLSVVNFLAQSRRFNNELIKTDEKIYSALRQTALIGGKFGYHSGLFRQSRRHSNGKLLNQRIPLRVKSNARR